MFGMSPVPACWLFKTSETVLLTLKVVSESRVTWATSVPILVFLGLSVLELRPMYATNVRQTSDKIIALFVYTVSRDYVDESCCSGCSGGDDDGLLCPRPYGQHMKIITIVVS